MATLRAAAFILNGALILVALYLLGETNKPEQVLLLAVIGGTPIVNIITLVLQGRGHQPAASQR
jgi:hypothetical protein